MPIQFVKDDPTVKNHESRRVGFSIIRPEFEAKNVQTPEGNIIVFGVQESYIENAGTRQRIPTSRRKCVLVVQLDAQPGSRMAKNVRFDEPNTNEWRQISGGQRELVEEIRERP